MYSVKSYNGPKASKPPAVPDILNHQTDKNFKNINMIQSQEENIDKEQGGF